MARYHASAAVFTGLGMQRQGFSSDSSLIQRYNSIQGQNGESGPKKFLPEPDPR
jgi:hypothetical protein